MKKIIMLTVLMMFVTTAVSASSLNGDYKGNPIVKLKSNGILIDSGDVPAMIYDDKTVVPIAALRNLGANVIWDANTYSVDVSLPNPPNNSTITAPDETIDSLQEISAFLKAVKINPQSGSNLSSFEFVLDGDSAYLLAQMNIDNLTTDEIKAIVTILSATSQMIKFPYHGVFIKTFVKNSITGSIYVTSESARKYNNSQISLSQFQSEWIIEHIN